MSTQVNQGAIAPPNMGLEKTRVRDFKRMNPPMFYGYKMEEDP